MRLGRAAAALWLVASAACKPSTEGRCAQDADCPTGLACSQGGVCIARPPEVSVEVRTSAPEKDVLDGAIVGRRSGRATLEVLDRMAVERHADGSCAGLHVLDGIDAGQRHSAYRAA